MVLVEGLYFSYTGGPPYVLEGLDFRAEERAYVSILGENGSGKSTLVKLVLGLLSPQRGTVSIDSPRRAYVPQANELADSRFPITVREMMDSYRRLLKIRERGKTEAALEAVGARDCADRLVGELSGGQRQKVFIARAIMGEPGLLVLDEPSAGVDAASRKEIYACIKELNRSRGMTILSVEHNLEAALRNSTAVYHMEDGRGHSCDPKTYAAEYLAIDEGGCP
jgi:zinc transport system ATP-binding protein